MTFAQVVETSVTNNSSFQTIYYVIQVYNASIIGRTLLRVELPARHVKDFWRIFGYNCYTSIVWQASKLKSQASLIEMRLFGRRMG